MQRNRGKQQNENDQRSRQENQRYQGNISCKDGHNKGQKQYGIKHFYQCQQKLLHADALETSSHDFCSLACSFVVRSCPRLSYARNFPSWCYSICHQSDNSLSFMLSYLFWIIEIVTHTLGTAIEVSLLQDGGKQRHSYRFFLQYF